MQNLVQIDIQVTKDAKKKSFLTLKFGPLVPVNLKPKIWGFRQAESLILIDKNEKLIDKNEKKITVY